MYSSKGDIKDVNMKRGSSISHLSKHLQSQFSTDIGCGESLTQDESKAECALRTFSGFSILPCVLSKWLTFSKLISLILIPVIAGWAFVIYTLADTVNQRGESTEARDTMMKAIILGKIIYKLQNERDMSILYTSKIGPGTKTFLIKEYELTDNAISQMWAWPSNFDTNKKPYFRSKSEFILYISRHRAKLDAKLSKPYDEIVFYSEMIDFMMDWMVEKIKDSGFGDTWKTLVVFHKLTRCMLDTGLERAYGAMFFAEGNFPDPNLYDFYFRRIHRFNYGYRSATYYSNFVDPFMHTKGAQKNATIAVMFYRNVIKYSNFTGNYMSAQDAQDYFDNVTIRVNYMFLLKDSAAFRVVELINVTLSDHVTNIIIYGIVATIVIVSCPCIMFLSEALVSHFQAYSKVLEKTSNDLDIEKTKTDTLLYQMLPRTVAVRLQKRSTVDTEYFESATILFTSIVNFTRLTIECTPMDLVELLNVLYTSIDEKIEQYDVYKVETINDTYMVVSGVPVANGIRHSSEIAYLALDIRDMINVAIYTTKIRIPVQLMLGINTGPVSAGVIGTVMLRYCLFGDTVNLASRMKSHGKPNQIHISEFSHQHLQRCGYFRTASRGKINIKGKGEMHTYWLLGISGKQDIDMPQSSHQLPGEVDEISNDDGSVCFSSGVSITQSEKTLNPSVLKRKFSQQHEGAAATILKDFQYH